MGPARTHGPLQRGAARWNEEGLNRGGADSAPERELLEVGLANLASPLGQSLLAQGTCPTRCIRTPRLLLARRQQIRITHRILHQFSDAHENSSSVAIPTRATTPLQVSPKWHYNIKIYKKVKPILA